MWSFSGYKQSSQLLENTITAGFQYLSETENAEGNLIFRRLNCFYYPRYYIVIIYDNGTSMFTEIGTLELDTDEPFTFSSNGAEISLPTGKL